MLLDAATMLATNALLALVMGGFALFEGLGQRGARHLVAWGAANLLVSGAVVLLLLNETAHDPLLPVVANTMLVGFAGLCRTAARMCKGRPPDLGFAAGLVGVWVTFGLFALAFQPQAAHFGVGQGLCAAGLLATAWEFSRAGGPPLESRRAATWLFGAHALVIAVRAGATVLLPSRLGGIPVPYLALFSAEGIVFVAAGSFVLLALAKERINLENTSAVRTAHAHADAARRFLDNLVAGLPSVIYRGTFTAEGVFKTLYVSDNAWWVLGWAAADLGKVVQFCDLVHADDLPSLHAKDTAVRLSGASTADYRLRRPDGDWMWLRDRMRVAGTLPDGGQDIIGHLSDITAEREAAAQAIGAAKLATLGEMAGGLAQELDQPIGAMSAAAAQAADVLRRRRQAADPAVLKRLETIVAQGEYAREVVAHLRAFARRETGPPVAVDVAEVVRRALRLMQHSLGQAAIAVSVDLPHGLPPVLAQAVALEQVLVNLLANARDALSADHLRQRRIHVAAAADPASGMVRVTVADTGGGLAHDVLPRVFEPFFTTKAPGKASGLGLSVSYGIVRSFNGSIAAGNGREGAEFIVTLRQVPVAAAA